MRPLRIWAIYLIIVFIGGALLAPWLYALTNWGGPHFAWMQRLAENPFHRFVHRSFLVLALLGLWPLLRYLGFRSWRDLGLTMPTGQGRPFLAGFALGLVSLALVAGLAVASGARHFNLDHSIGQYLQNILKAASTALIVSLLEEVLFRGALFGSLRRSLHWSTALIISSVVYAWVHFFQRPPSPQQVDWTSGLVLLPGMMRGFVEWEMLVPGFFSLTLAGLLLGLAYQRSGTLYFSIGLHAGWIFWLKSYGFITIPNPNANVWFWGSHKLIDGWLALILLSLLGLILTKRWRDRPPQHHPPL